MTAKNFAILATIIMGIAVSTVLLFQKKEVSQEELCYKSESFEVKIKACGEILRNSSERYEQLTKEINTNSIVASGARNQIIRARDEFYKTTLSGLNVDF